LACFTQITQSYEEVVAMQKASFVSWDKC